MAAATARRNAAGMKRPHPNIANIISILHTTLLNATECAKQQASALPVMRDGMRD
jgi:hypothetical protein